MYKNTHAPVGYLNASRYIEIMFANDLNAYRAFPGKSRNGVIRKSANKCQEELHSWGAANQVSFDPSKESKHVLSRTDPHGPNFKLLGVIFDCRLFMDDAVRAVTAKIKWKLQMLLRSRRSFSTKDLVIQYKQQVMSCIEYRTVSGSLSQTSAKCQHKKHLKGCYGSTVSWGN